MKTLKKSLTFIFIISLFCITAEAKTIQHTVVKGESMWKIAVKYQVGLSEIISANPQVSNPALIYPNQVLNIPLMDESITSFEQQVIDLTNEKRASRGLKPLNANWELSRVARYKSQDMANNKYFSHTSPTYGSPFNMIKNFGIKYRSAGENIAYGQRTPAQVVNSWWNSAGHRANMLNANYTDIGVGYVANGNYWTQMFIQK
ncbi:MAG: SafA/ExsA family spore coat assembly protein [Monoglobus pectinilyticus]|uniref:SafA/ExsA family spore coat assembly protein n=1 Tax=Monoglobus pectinilyticus TaxID=1981510 RepID=UPI00399AB425